MTSCWKYDQILLLVGGATQIADKIVLKFVQEAYKNIDAIQQDDYKLIRQHAHSLKGSSSYVYAESLNSICVELQIAAESRVEWNKIYEIRSRLEQEFKRVIQDMELFLCTKEEI
jgi:HPt (histidine-containing phosphotransfer) domain-containing protein